MRRKVSKTAWIDPDSVPRDAFVLADSLQPGVVPPHAHRRAQLIHAAEGILTVKTALGLWVVPPQRALWMPPAMEHSVAAKRPYRLLTLYVTHDVVSLSENPRVVAVDRLAAELMEAAVRFGGSYPVDGPEARLIQVLLDRLSHLEVAPLHLPEPTSPELKRICATLESNPSDPRTLMQLSSALGLTERTAARRFLAETNLTFGQWRQQLRLLAALDRLAAGESVTSVALEVGYRDTSSFVAAFKKALGTTPARYFGSPA